MATKTVEFLKVELLDGSNSIVDIKKIKEILEEVFNKYCAENKDCKSLDLSPEIKPDDIEPKKILDVFDDDLYLFGRVSKKKSRNALIRRNYDTLEADEVFNTSESLRQGVEVFTFFIMDYEKGIVAIANAKDAPGASDLNKIFENYCSGYHLDFTGIPNADGINALFGAPKPEISKIEFEITRPNVEYLMKVLELDESIVMEMLKDKNFSANLVIKAEPYKKLENDQGIIKQVINKLKSVKDNYEKTVITGSSEDFNTRKFDLHAKFFTYPLDIKNYHWLQKKKVEYTLKEITKQFQEGLHEAYLGNYNMITALADRME